MAIRAAQEIQDKKKRQVAVYEKLEMELTKFELEEEEDEAQMNKLLDQIRKNDANLQQHEQIMIADGNIFNNDGPKMNS